MNQSCKLTPDEAFVWSHIHEHSISWIAAKLQISTDRAHEYYTTAAQKVTHTLAAEVKRVDEPYELLTYLEAEAFKYRGASRERWVEQAKRLGIEEHDFALALSRATLKLYDVNGPNVAPPEALSRVGEKGDFFHD